MLYILFTFITAAMAQNSFVGFARGNNLMAVPLQGQVRVLCDGFNGHDSATYDCRDVVLEPQPYDYFLGPLDSRASKVELTSIREDGSVRVRMVGYDGNKGRSTDSFNLWISTLFQKPLLSLGSNTVNYKIYSSSNVKDPYAQGTFKVSVTRSAVRQCPSAQYTSTDANDCSSQYSVCQRYFDEYRQCK